jgi:hypothetical protein
MEGVVKEWTVATALGEAAGFMLPAVAGPLVMGRIPAGTPGGTLATICLAAACGLSEGAGLGWFQSRVLRRAFSHFDSRAWTLRTAFAASFAWVLGFSPSQIMDWTTPEPWHWVATGSVIGPLLLFSIGFAQWTVLRAYVRRPGRWIWSSTLAWVLGASIPVFGIMAVPDGSSVFTFAAAGVVSALLMGACAGGITGLVLQGLLTQGPDLQAP